MYIKTRILLVQIDFFRLQTKTPMGNRLTSLGIYIVISLMFLIGSMVELVGMLFLQRIIAIREEDNVGVNEESVERGAFKIHKLCAKVDGVALILFSLTFITFNCLYWMG